MLTIRKSSERGHFNHGWLDTYHTFSFGEYHDPAHMGFRSLRVINEDRVAPGMGFGMHPHRDMEIVTWVLGGALQHKDSLGNGEVLRPGEIQRMSAGTGIRHSEFNPSPTEPVHLLQIWIMPERAGLAPSYEQRAVAPAAAAAGQPAGAGRALQLIVSPPRGGGVVTIQQDASILLARLSAGESARHALASGRAAWVQVMRGGLTVNGQPLDAGDGAALEREAALDVLGAAGTGGEALFFDLA